jgi:hypothetical protein
MQLNLVMCALARIQNICNFFPAVVIAVSNSQTNNRPQRPPPRGKFELTR